MSSDFPIVPAMMTVSLLAPDISVGPVKFFVGPIVY